LNWIINAYISVHIGPFCFIHRRQTKGINSQTMNAIIVRARCRSYVPSYFVRVTLRLSSWEF